MDASGQPCIEVTGAAEPALCQWLQAELARAVAGARSADGEGVRVVRMSVRIVGDAQMSQLHKRHSGIAGTTDVLTFVGGEAVCGDGAASGGLAAEQLTGGSALEIDAAICADEAARRCGDFGHGLREELLLYAVHALLHAVGFDDATADQHARMHAEEDRLLQHLGHGALYSGRGRAA
jgi:probable rRNA maturation factor